MGGIQGYGNATDVGFYNEGPPPSATAPPGVVGGEREGKEDNSTSFATSGADAAKANDAEFTDQLFNQFENMTDYPLMDDVCQMGDWPSTSDYLMASAISGNPQLQHQQQQRAMNRTNSSGGIMTTLEGRMGQTDGGAVLVPPPSATGGRGGGEGKGEGGEEEGGREEEHDFSDNSSVPDEFDDEHDEEDGSGGGREDATAAGGSNDGAGKGQQPRKRARVARGGGGVDRQKQRNREHARNTRARKKAYIETLRTQLQSLSDERDQSEKTVKTTMAKTVEEQAVRKQVLQTFLVYRARGELERQKWAGILSDDFVLKMPITPYRYLPASDVFEQARHIRGIDNTIRDTASFTVLIDSLSRTYKDTVRVQFFAEAEWIIQVENTLMCRWLMKTENAVHCGGQIELQLCGMLHAEFGPDNKLTKVAMVFDVMSFMQQLRRCTGGNSFQIAPSTMQLAEEPSDEPRIIVALRAPFLIRSINQAWMITYGVTLGECSGKGMMIERNPQAPPPAADGSDPASQRIRATYESMEKQLPLSIVVIYFMKVQGPICARLRMFPVMSGGVVTNYMGGLVTLRDVSFPHDYPVMLVFR